MKLNKSQIATFSREEVIKTMLYLLKVRGLEQFKLEDAYIVYNEKDEFNGITFDISSETEANFLIELNK